MSTSTTSNNYLSTSSVGWGTPTQKFKLLVDTTDHTSWVYNGSTNTPSPTFKSSDSSTFTISNDKITYSYQGVSMDNVYKATDTITVDNSALVEQSFGVATERFNITDDEGLSGFLALDRSNTIISGLHNNGSIGNQTVTIDAINNKLYFGPHTPSPINTYSNATSCSSTTGNEYLDNDWTFDADVTFDGDSAATLGSMKVVIDSGSPYITIYAIDQNTFETLWHKVDGTQATSDFNCNYTTRLCDSTSIMETMSIYVGSHTDGYTWSVNISRDDVLDGKSIQFYYDADRDFTNGATCNGSPCNLVFFLGRPFLKNVIVELDYNDEALTFYTLNSTTDSLNWVTILIVFGSVLAFALLFFGLYWWKYGRIPPPSNNDVEEQSLLRGPSVQAVGTGSGANQGAMYQGMSDPVGPSGGLDDDDYERQLQNAQRQSQIEAQQQRERQMREDAQRREREEMEQQAQLQQAQSRARQEDRGGRLGGAADKPQDKDDLRARRLKFLEDQEKKANEQGDDQ